MDNAKIENSNMQLFKELAERIGVAPEKLLRELANVSKKFGGLAPDTLILNTSGITQEERDKRKEFDPPFNAVVSVDIDETDAEDIKKHIGKTVWGLPLLHLHTEYVARALISSIVNGGDSGQVFVPSAIITLAAALEAAIGEATLVKCRAMLGHEHYRSPAQAICKLGPIQRLEAIVPFASKGEFVLRREDSKPAGLIRNLIPLRNHLVHQNLEYLPFKLVEAAESSAPYGLEFPPAFQKHLARIRLDNNQLQAYWAAYLGLKRSFLRTDTYSEDDFLRKTSG